MIICLWLTRTLNLGGNLISGGIPTGLGLLTQLTYVRDGPISLSLIWVVCVVLCVFERARESGKERERV